ncbi:MAG TPA: tRNA guanosine(34) transglycosylase Tgt [Candidatus Methylomirabilis sp.]|nr:tRNA guanosine(34) transglycosylase Tgt [Candidatus Methylomirabilis sp.]
MANKKIKTNRGILTAPFFMPDATRGLVKFLSPEEVASAGIKALVVNTLHLYLEPGLKIIKKAGGIHKLMNWDKPIISDSGGYQVFSLIHKNSKMGKITDDGAVFHSPADGSVHEITPEKAIQIQFDLGVDMMVCLDDCPPNEFSRADLARAVKRTIAWAKRCKNEYEKQIKKRKISKSKRPLLFGVIQGGTELDLRELCTRELIKIGFDGYGFGARHVDREGKFLADVLKFTADLIPANKIKFALGVGKPEDIVLCYKMGWDIFDCVIPTREGRHGKLFCHCEERRRRSNPANSNRNEIASSTSAMPWRDEPAARNDIKYQTINIGNSRFAADFLPINAQSKIPELKNHSLAYLHHLFKINDPLGARLASLNNLEFYSELMKKMTKKKTG